MLCFGYNLKPSNTQINCKIGISTKNPKVIFIFFYVAAYLQIFIQQQMLELENYKVFNQ